MMKPQWESCGVNADDDNPNICMLLANQIICVTLIRKPNLNSNKNWIYIQQLMRILIRLV